jgi:hypothetical protein
LTLLVQLSEKAKENLQCNKLLIQKESKFISIDENSYLILNFDPEKIEAIENQTFGKKRQDIDT